MILISGHRLNMKLVDKAEMELVKLWINALSRI